MLQNKPTNQQQSTTNYFTRGLLLHTVFLLTEITARELTFMGVHSVIKKMEAVLKKGNCDNVRTWLFQFSYVGCKYKNRMKLEVIKCNTIAHTCN